MRALFNVFLAALMAACSCQRDASTDDPTTHAIDPARVNAPTVDTEAAAAAANVAKQSQQRDDALYNAISTLHKYLSAVAAQDWKKADDFWVNRQAADGEADLRALKSLRSLRIENGVPKSLDNESIPNAIEVPVNLRAGLTDAPQQRYRGWYRMRRDISGKNWEITSASLAIETR